MPPLEPPFQHQEHRPTKKDMIAECPTQRKKNMIAERTVYLAKNDLERMVSRSPFLLNTPADPNIAYLHKSEIIKGALLGKGGFSDVYEVKAIKLSHDYEANLSHSQVAMRQRLVESCIDPDSNQPRYAIKQLKESLRYKPKDFVCAATDLALEADYLSRLNHPNIVSVRGLALHGLNALLDGEHDGMFIIMDKAYDTLDKRIQAWDPNQQACLLETKANMALQVAQALEYLHSNNIVFRDLKGPNIGLTLNDDVILMDFGLSRDLPHGGTSDDVYEMSSVGTRRYMAVEVVKHERYNTKVDVYSWALVFWEMLTNEKAYKSFDADDHYEMVCLCGERPNLHQANIPDGICNLLEASWSQDVTSRLDSTEVVALLSILVGSFQKKKERAIKYDYPTVSKPLAAPISPAPSLLSSSSESSSATKNLPAYVCGLGEPFDMFFSDSELIQSKPSFMTVSMSSQSSTLEEDSASSNATNNLQGQLQPLCSY
jgi:serine/threonine protein kinase